ncbi:MAG: hypothetical protein JXA71_00185 [Chitinispirillaceae bacterium]|nr:hypothetical protein [Chitinispirillaceae bacterium]
MTIRHRLAFACSIGACLVALGWGQYLDDEPKPWEKYGLSQTEWKMIKDNNIPLSKVEELLKAGISISEYVEQPWKKLSLSERQYIQKRRSGLTAYDIELEQTSKHGGWKDENRDVLDSEVGAFSGSKGLALSFALPGYQQYRLKHRWRARVMSALAVGSVAASVIITCADGAFEGTPLFVILVPDMFWSFIDFKFTQSKNE